MIVAPNSPSDRAQLITRPAASAALASGTVMARNSCRSDAPSTRAASSRSRSTPAIPVRAERTKNGADTKVWARITATVVNGIEIAEDVERLRQQAAPAEDEQQGEAGDRRRQDDRQVDDGLQPALAAELPSGQDEGQRQAEDDGDREADGRRHEAQPERVEDDRRGDRRGQRAIEDRPHDERDDREAEEQREQRGQGGERALPPAARSPLARPGAGRPQPALRPRPPSRGRQEPEAAQGSPGRRVRRTSRGTPWPRPRSGRP